MRDMLVVLVFVVSLAVTGFGIYAGVTMLSLMKKKALRAGLPPEELDDIHTRLAAADALEGRVAELEERLDFAERLIAEGHDTERLPPGGAHNH